jgi:hypothetical protein
LLAFLRDFAAGACLRPLCLGVSLGLIGGVGREK